MGIVYMRVRFSEKYSEWFVDDAEATEIAIESVVGPALLQMFGEVEVENVTIQPDAKHDNGDGGQESARRENMLI